MLLMARQIKAARSLLGWEQNELAIQSGVAVSTIRRIERQRDAPLAANFRTVEKIRYAMERAGIEFLGSPSPGVRMCQQCVLDSD
jgi:transcriptional regulator with XRE-family HTH domain